MALSANDLSQQMVQQLRLLDNAISAEIGTPERKVVDTVASALASVQIDQTGLLGALDIDSKFGSNLDSFIGIFGFSRVGSTYATGNVIFYRNAPASVDITIPIGTVILSNVTDPQGIIDQYVTTATATIPAAGTQTAPVPVSASSPGTASNAPAGTLTVISTSTGNTINGVSSVNNPAAITRGLDQEDDNSLKVRFKNTLFRNLAGTPDYYLALAISTAFSTKANVIGPISQYQEYYQVPSGDDSTTIGGQSGGGNAGQFTTALSTIPYAQYIYSSSPVFVTDSQSGVLGYFYRPGIDFTLNWPATNSGDTLRYSQLGGNIEPYILNQPNLTFLNVYSGTNETIQAISPSDIVLVEYSYLSSASRNSITHNVTNAIDVYVDGQNPTQATTVFLPPVSAGTNVAGVTDSPANMFYLENFRRDGQPTKRPQAGNVITPLFFSPLINIPNQISVGGQNYYIGINYWLVHETSTLAGSVRARDGIEWSMDVGGQVPGTDGNPPATFNGSSLVSGDPTAPFVTTGNHITNWASSSTPITVTNYNYDKNIVDLQATFQAKQITTDVLAHSSTARYFKLDLSIMYSSGSTQSAVNLAIQTALQNYFSSQYFGSVIQLSDLLQIVHAVSGVDNVRWSYDVPSQTPPVLTRVYETDVNGNSLAGVSVDRTQTAKSGLQQEIHNIYFTGQPVTGTFVLNYPGFLTSAISIPSAWTPTNILTLIAALQNAINVALSLSCTVTQINMVTTGVNYPVYTFQVQFPGTSTYSTPTVTYPVPVSTALYLNNYDFFLRDNELPQLAQNISPGDTLAGLIIRPRTQNTFIGPLI